jgi:hypothetical protein
MQNYERRIEDRRAERERVFRDDNAYHAHMKVIREAYETTRMDFWCEECQKDFTSDAYKVIGEAGQWPVAWYAGLCPENHVCIRYITDKENDSYYWKSKMIREQRHEMADAMLIPSDPRFKLVYPEKWRELEKLRDE